jgi:hydrogenase-4 component E
MQDIAPGMNLINGLAALILLAAFVIVASKRMQNIVRAFTLQSVALGLLAASVAYYTGADHIYVVAALTIVIKGLIIPRFLDYTIERIHVDREVEPLLNIPSSLLVAGGLAFVAYYVTEPIIAIGSTIARNVLAISLAVVLIGFFIMISRRKAITQVAGLLVMENGLFLGAISLTYGMPLIVELGIFFDVLVAVVIMGVFAFRINRTFETLDTTILRRLRG